MEEKNIIALNSCIFVTKSVRNVLHVKKVGKKIQSDIAIKKNPHGSVRVSRVAAEERIITLGKSQKSKQLMFTKKSERMRGRVCRLIFSTRIEEIWRRVAITF